MNYCIQCDTPASSNAGWCRCRCQRCGYELPCTQHPEQKKRAMKLSEMRYEDIKHGQVVHSPTGKKGTVEKKWKQPDDRFDENYVCIRWEDGSESSNWLVWMNEVEVVN